VPAFAGMMKKEAAGAASKAEGRMPIRATR
jgi:hypothetical protein